MTKSWKCLCFALSILTGCASAPSNADKEAARIAAMLSQTMKEARTCYDLFDKDPRFAFIYEKLAIAHPATAAQLSDNEHVSAKLVPIGLDWYALQQGCNRIEVEGLARIDPQLGIAAAGWVQEGASIMEEAVTEQPTYGRLNVRIDAQRNRERQDLRAWTLALRSRLDSERAAEQAEAQRQDAKQKAQFASAVGMVADLTAQALDVAVQVMNARQAALASVQRNYGAAYPVYVPVRRITVTRCGYIGRVFTCTTQ